MKKLKKIREGIVIFSTEEFHLSVNLCLGFSIFYEEGFTPKRRIEIVLPFVKFSYKEI